MLRKKSFDHRSQNIQDGLKDIPSFEVNFGHSLFTNDVLNFLSVRSPRKNRLAKLTVVRPLGEFDLDNQHGLNPMAASHDRRCNPQAPSAFGFLW